MQAQQFTSIHEAAENAAAAFETATRDNGESYDRVKDDSPEWITTVVREAHGEMLPDDWRYKFVREALVRIADEGGDYDDLSELGDEFADDVSIYTFDLTAWLGSHAERPGYCDEAASEFGDPGNDSILTRIQRGQYMERREVFDSVVSSLREMVES